MAMEKSRETRLRRQARRLGLEVRKDRARSLNLDHFGGYMIVDPRRNWIVAGGKWDLDLDQVEEFLAAEERGLADAREAG